MKSKILILLLFCSFFSFGQSVPNTNTFSLQDVVGVVGGTSLTQAFSNSVDAYFDPTYKGSKDRLSNFRNYTIPSCVPPTVTTASITAILATSATGGGNVTATGGCAVTARGVCWSTSTNPTISDSHTTDGSGTGLFTSSITSLMCGLTYYARAYATNSAGTSYGSQVSLVTGTTNYPTILLTSSINTSTCGFTGNFTSSFALAQAACQDFKDSADGLCSITAFGGYGFKGESLSVGTQLYFFNECTIRTDSGYWLYSPQNSNRAIVYLINGVIQSITPCP